jgi:hypothetical protein
MARLRLKIRDQARYQKKYPLTRHLPKTRLISDQIFEMETHRVTVASTDIMTMEWESPFSASPAVSVTFISSDATQGDVNIWCAAVSTTQLTVRMSAACTGVIAIQAIVLPE